VSTGWLGRNRAWVLIIGCLLLATAVSAWVSSGGVTYAGRLDPQNPDPDGGRALAQVLGDQGVDVLIVRAADAYDAADVDGATILVTSSDNLGRSTYRGLLAHSGTSEVVIVEPGRAVARLFNGGAATRAVDPSAPVAAQCADTRLSLLQLEVERAHAYTSYDGSCFPAGGGAIWTPAGGERWFFGAGDAFSNDQITRSDNAAVALRLLGQRDRLVWYVPDVTDLRAGDEVGLGSLLPRWLTPALWLGGIVLVALVGWRGRRLGPLVTEPLPVVVKAIETTQSRGRLYRKAGDRSHAAAALRASARARAAERLRLPRHPDERQLLPDVARHTGRPVDELGALLSDSGPTPCTDKELTALAGRLAELDDCLRKAPR